MKKTLATIVALTLLLLAAIFLNIPVLREITAFIYLSFVPGFLILRILNLGKMNLTFVLLFSVGLSLVFLMFIGLLINKSSLLGISQPLSAVPLALGVSISTAVLIFVCNRRNLLNEYILFKTNWKITGTFYLRIAIVVLPIFLSAIGALFLNIIILMLSIASIAALYVLSMLSKKLIPSELYPLLIFSISLALLFQVVFTSKYILGFDANLEYYVFKSTQIQTHWSFINPILNTVPNVDYNAMLSITVLPTIYASMTNASGELVFKLLYPFIFSLVPVTLYQTFERQIGRSAALSSVLFFAFGLLVFYGLTPISLDRQIVATLFLVLSIFVLLNKTMPVKKGRVLLVIFGAAIAVSHYSLMYIYLVFVFFIYFLSKLKNRKNQALNSTAIIFLLTITGAWYYFSYGPLASLNGFLSGFFSKFSADLLNPAARSTNTYVTQSVLNPINSVSLAIFFIANFLVAIGILRIVFRPRNTGLDSNYRTIAILSAILLFISFLLPNIAPSLNISRFYSISLLLLVPCFVLGFSFLIDLSKKILRKISSQNILRDRSALIENILLCVILIAFLFTQTGFINRITNNTPLLRSLDLDRVKTSNDTQLKIDYYSSYLQDQDVFGSVWLQQNGHSNSIVYSDYTNQVGVLTSYGLIPGHLTRPLTNSTSLSQYSYVFLGKENTIDNILLTINGPINSSEIFPLLNQTDKIYSNGGTEVMYTVSAK